MYDSNNPTERMKCGLEPQVNLTLNNHEEENNPSQSSSQSSKQRTPKNKKKSFDAQYLPRTSKVSNKLHKEPSINEDLSNLSLKNKSKTKKPSKLVSSIQTYSSSALESHEKLVQVIESNTVANKTSNVKYRKI